MRTRLITSSCIVLASLVLAACGGGDDADKDAEGKDVKQQTLALGESATLTGPDDKYEVEVAIDAEEGKVGDLKGFNLEDDEAKMTPWYVRTTFTNDNEFDPDEAWHWIRTDLEDEVNNSGLDALWREAIWLL